MQSAPICLMGNSVALTTNGSINTNTSFPIVYEGAAGLNLPGAKPPNIRLLNVGTAVVWFSMTNPAAVAAVAPTAGTTDMGTPRPVSWLYPLIEISLTIPCSIAGLSGVAGSPLGFWLNVISGTASQNIYLQLGDGT